MPWSFCSIATRAYSLGVYLCSKRRGLMPWNGTTCMIKMIVLHSRVKVALSGQVVKLMHEVDIKFIVLMLIDYCYVMLMMFMWLNIIVELYA